MKEICKSWMNVEIIMENFALNVFLVSLHGD